MHSVEHRLTGVVPLRLCYLPNAHMTNMYNHGMIINEKMACPDFLHRNVKQKIIKMLTPYVNYIRERLHTDS